MTKPAADRETAGNKAMADNIDVVLVRKLAGLPASPVLTLALLAVLLVFLYLGTTDMFKGTSETGSLSSEIFFSPLFLAVVLIFEINLISCTVRQLKKAVTPHMKASVLFHTGLIIIVSGALIQLAFGFTGYVRITEGAVIENRPNQYYIAREGVFHLQESGKSELFLQKTDIPPGNAPEEIRGLLALVRNGDVVAKEWVGKGDSLSHKRMDIAFNRMGYYLMLDFSDTMGKTSVYPLLLQSMETPGGSAYSGSRTISGTDYVISVKSQHVPEFEITVAKTGSGGQAETVYQGRAAVGDTVSLERYNITLSHLTPWMIFRTRYEYGFYIIYAGMLIATAGMFILYGRREL